jgi:hypothetical protein
MGDIQLAYITTTTIQQPKANLENVDIASRRQAMQAEKGKYTCFQHYKTIGVCSKPIKALEMILTSTVLGVILPLLTT